MGEIYVPITDDYIRRVLNSGEKMEAAYNIRMCSTRYRNQVALLEESYEDSAYVMSLLITETKKLDKGYESNLLAAHTLRELESLIAKLVDLGVDDSVAKEISRSVIEEGLGNPPNKIAIY